MSNTLALGCTGLSTRAFSLQAYGLAAADVVQEEQTPCAKNYSSETKQELVKQLVELGKGGAERLKKHGFYPWLRRNG